MLPLHNTDQYFSTIDDMQPGVLPKCAGYVKPGQIKQVRVVINTYEINQELIDKVSNNVELIALSCKNSIVAALQKMENVKLDKLGNYLAFWRTGVIALVLIYNENLITNDTDTNKWVKGDDYTFINIPNKVLTFNLDAIDESLKSDPIAELFKDYRFCNLY